MIGSNPGPPVIHDLPGAAERAKVTPDVIRRWIREGLRATPVGSVGKRGPSDYRIFDSWLLAFLKQRAEVRSAGPSVTGSSPEGEAVRPSGKPAKSRRGRSAKPAADWMGPCPRPKSRG